MSYYTKSLFAAAAVLLASAVSSFAATSTDPVLYDDLDLGVVNDFAGFDVGTGASGPATLNVRYGRWTGAGDAVLELIMTFNGTALSPVIDMDNTYFSSPESVTYDVSGLLTDGLNTLSAFATLTSGGSTTYAIGELSLEYSEVSAVPLPASLPLVLAGVFAFGALRMRHRKSA